MKLEYFQMVDRIDSLDLDAGAIRVVCQVPDTSPVFEGHFPGYPRLPGALMIETMAQAGGWLVLAHLRFAKMPFLMQVERAKMRGFVLPGEALEATAKLTHDGSGYAVIEGAIARGGKKVADAEIRYGVVPFPNAAMRGTMLAKAREIGVDARYLPHEPSDGEPGHD